MRARPPASARIVIANERRERVACVRAPRTGLLLLYNPRHSVPQPLEAVFMRHFRLIVPWRGASAPSLFIFALGVIVFAGASVIGKQALAPAAATGPFDTLHFRSIGPAGMSGRISDIAVYEANTNIFYVASAHGGVWKTTNNGTTFEAQLQNHGLMSIGDVTVSQSNPDLVWVGTGESNNRQSGSWGDGV